jgi:hypothetical protein
MSKEVAALALTVLVHFVGIGALVFALVIDEDKRPDWRGWWPRDEEDPRAPEPASGPGGAPLPLADAQPSRVRLRDDRRLGDAHRQPARRPAHPPQRTPERTPADAG